mmetsp:Transcript_16947/g.52618  ORF Transcript_16947/g.52618 Transcript_16947/m.52618 type:complete len:323 (-) Transcript_16947:101-1069(-)
MGLCGSKSTVPNADPRKDWERGVPVYVNVYDLQARGGNGAPVTVNGAMGLGAYHSGVQVFNAEFSFGGDPTGKCSAQTGIFSVNPKSALPSSQFHKQHLVGHLPAGTLQQQVFALVNKMKPDWLMSSYHLVKRNCNHFSEAFLWALDEEFNIKPATVQREAAIAEEKRTGKPATIPKPKIPERTLFLPAYINRAARFGSYMAPNAVIRALSRNAPTAEVPDDTAGPSRPPPGTTGSGGAGSSNANSGTTRPSGTTGQSAEELRKQHPLPNDRSKLEHMSARELRAATVAHGVDTTGCIEKGDYVDAILRHHDAVGTPAGGTL